MRLYDISIPIQPSLAVWPGDTPFALTWNMRIAKGDSINLSMVTMSVHTATHMDAPCHFRADGAAVDACALERFCGPAVVIDLSGATEIAVADIERVCPSGISRVLFKTMAWTDHSVFPTEVPVMADDVPAYLHSRDMVLVGVDVPSVDKIESKDLPNHHRLAEYGIGILEALDLREVPSGVYELIALPLRLVGADGSPVRAVLRCL